MNIIEENYFTQSDIASKYDSYIGLNMPYYWPAIEFIANAVLPNFQDKTVSNIVEFGVGSGNLCCSVIPSLKVEHLCIIDHSNEFLRISQRKLLDAVTYPLQSFKSIKISFVDENWTNGILENSVDIALSSFTFDHISDESLPQVYSDIYALLRPGGIFTIAEKCAESDRQSTSYLSYQRSIDIRTKHNRNHRLKSEDEIVNWRHHNFHDDQMRPLSTHIDILEKIGFSVRTIAGVPLPNADNMTYENYYEMTSIELLTRQFVFNTDLALGVGILICNKI